MAEYNAKFKATDNDVYVKIKDIEDQISKETERYKKRMDQLNERKQQLKEFASDLELKYHIFDSIFDPENDTPEDYFTERDIYFYKWVEAMKYVKEYSNLFDILSKKKYHAPEKFALELINPLESYCVICLLKKAIIINNEIIRAVKLTPLYTNVLNVDYYTKDALVNSIRIEDNSYVYYTFLDDHPEIDDSDKYTVSIKQTKMETDLIKDILDSDHKENTLEILDTDTIRSKLREIMALVNECNTLINTIMESDE